MVFLKKENSLNKLKYLKNFKILKVILKGIK